jgi:smad nuclear-interacting protein 1
MLAATVNSPKILTSRCSDENQHKPDFENSGLLAAATNTVHKSDGTKAVLKYNEPPEARKPTEHWRLYDFEDEKNPGES